MPIGILPRPIWTPGPTIHSWSRESIGLVLGASSTLTSAVYPTANKAFYVPFTIPDSIVVVKLFQLNGATASGNFDVGIYNDIGTRLVSSGSTAQAGTNVVQAVDITDIVLPAGLYYMAVAFNGTTGTLFRNATNADQSRGAGILEQTTAFALPATATFASTTVGYIPAIGISMRVVLD